MSKTVRSLTFVAAVVAVASACGARTGLGIELIGSDDAGDEAGIDAPTSEDAMMSPDTAAIDGPEESTILDASAEASPGFACPPTFAQPMICPVGTVCIIEVTEGACLPPNGGVPDADILSGQCAPLSNWLLDCYGGTPLEVHYDPNTGQPIWAVCV